MKSMNKNDKLIDNSYFVLSCIPRKNTHKRRGIFCQNNIFFFSQKPKSRKTNKEQKGQKEWSQNCNPAVQFHWDPLASPVCMTRNSTSDNKPILPCFRDIMQPKTCTFKFLISFALILIKLSSLQEFKNSELFFPPLKSMFFHLGFSLISHWNMGGIPD